MKEPEAEPLEAEEDECFVDRGIRVEAQGHRKLVELDMPEQVEAMRNWHARRAREESDQREGEAFAKRTEVDEEEIREYETYGTDVYGDKMSEWEMRLNVHIEDEEEVRVMMDEEDVAREEKRQWDDEEALWRRRKRRR